MSLLVSLTQKLVYRGVLVVGVVEVGGLKLFSKTAQFGLDFEEVRKLKSSGS